MTNEFKESKTLETQVEKFEYASDGEAATQKTVQDAAMGTVTITDLDEIFLVPAPSADPQGSSYFLKHSLRY